MNRGCAQQRDFSGGSLIDSDKRIAGELKRKLAEVVELLDYRVFGSRARGNADEYSDLDIFIEVEFLDADLRGRISDIVWDVGFANYTVISSLVFTRDELENSPLRASPIVQSIQQEGVRL